MQYQHRVAEKALHRYLGAFPVVGVTGPRQSGKSTLLKAILPDYDYVTFDDFRNVDFISHDPIAFMQRYSDRVIFDEVQFVPEIFNLVKMAVDNDRQNYGKFVLTGSSQFSYLKKASESLAGRMGLLQLLPFQYEEIKTQLKEASIYQGAYPELVQRDYSEAGLWYSSYLDTYLNKDVAALLNVGDVRDFRRLIQLLAANTSQVVDYTSYATAIGVSVPTIKRWLAVLEASYIIFMLPPFYKNFGKRIIKSPKVYFYDTGLVAFLTGVSTQALYEQGPLAGAIFENYIICEIVKSVEHQALPYDFYYLRTSDKKEVDLIVDKKQSRDLIEIKKGKSFKPRFTEHVEAFKQEADKALCLYSGETLDYKETVQVMNYADYLLHGLE